MEDRKIFEQRKESIRNMIYDEEYIPLKFKEMAYLMNVPHNEKDKLREVLDALVAEGSVELTARGKYVKADQESLVGVFTAHPRGFGFVTVEGEPEDIFIPAPYTGGAFHKDVVRVKISRESHGEGKRREGVVVKVLERGTKTLVGTFMKSRSFGFVRPDDTHYGQDVFISKKDCDAAMNNDKVVVELLNYGTRDKKPEGRIVEIIGNTDDPSTDITAIVRAFGIPDTFSGEVMREARSIPDEVTIPKGENRTDFRNLLTVTIDGEDAKDLDDAITLSRQGDGYELGVHIADVSNYVKEGAPLDKEALERGTSVYLCDRVIPMLPRELSNGICSLNAGVDRLALSCVMQVDARGNVIGHQIVESVIRVDKRMSYTGVKAILEGQPHPEGEREDIRELCFLMKEAAAVLKEKRRKRGAIDFDFPESKIVLDKDGYPTDIHPYERNVATDIIEDFMLLANETVAEDYFWQELPFVYRTHEEPDPDKIARLDTFIRNFGFYMKTGREHFHPKEIQKLLFSLEGEPEEALISRLALRSMKQARYSTLNVGHFGLSTQYYTHFTSPIRRYPDLQIHRIIKENIHGRLNRKRVEHYEAILPSVAEQSSKRERRAQDAEREVEKLKKLEYMEKFIGDAFDGVISGVTAKGFFVELENTVEGMVSTQSLMDDYYLFDEQQYRLEGKRTGRVFTLGQKVRVVMASASKAAKTIDFVLEEFSAAAGWDVHGEKYNTAGSENDDSSREEEILFDGTEEEWYSDEEEGWIQSKDDIAKNDWLDDEEADRLLKLYAKKDVRDI
ncbi:ribonuclease R [Eubacterium sp. An11]|nr:ribonuclease R [Eubacterium sp. An11]OUQ69798.1 ribonuclease R [Eubacterium sp. An11]